MKHGKDQDFVPFSAYWDYTGSDGKDRLSIWACSPHSNINILILQCFLLNNTQITHSSFYYASCCEILFSQQDAQIIYQALFVNFNDYLPF